jgi:hypothetical protein
LKGHELFNGGGVWRATFIKGRLFMAGFIGLHLSNDFPSPMVALWKLRQVSV